jgi:hypothetical protein
MLRNIRSQSVTLKQPKILVLFAFCCVVGAMMFPVAKKAFFGKPAQDEMLALYPSLMPWTSVGGCGAGGSGGGGGGAKWVGKGVTGGLLDVQLMYSNSIGQNFFNNSFSTRLSMKPRWDTQIGLSIPMVSKISEFQPQSIFEPKYFITGGLGDVSLDISQNIGMEGQYSLGLALCLPTGQYDIKRGPDAKKEFMSTGLQKGTGMYNASLSFGYSKDVEDGIWLIDCSYSNPFNMKLFSGKNQYLDDYFTQFKDSTSNPRFYYHFKYYGENDLGDYTPPSANASIYYGYKGIEGYMHSWGVTFGVPFAVAWIHNELLNGTTTAYKPRPDPDHKAWSATLNYGMEVSKPKFPLFFAVCLPIHDKSNPEAISEPDLKKQLQKFAQWDPPDFKDFLQQWTLAVGIKSTMF